MKIGPTGLQTEGAAGVKQMDLRCKMGMSRGGASIATRMFSFTFCSYQLYYIYIYTYTYYIRIFPFFGCYLSLFAINLYNFHLFFALPGALASSTVLIQLWGPYASRIFRREGGKPQWFTKKSWHDHWWRWIFGSMFFCLVLVVANDANDPKNSGNCEMEVRCASLRSLRPLLYTG